jgi:hypothetical protein
MIQNVRYKYIFKFNLMKTFEFPTNVQFGGERGPPKKENKEQKPSR